MHARASIVSEPDAAGSTSRRDGVPGFQPRPANLRVFVFYSLAIVLTGIGSLLFADLLWRTGWSTSRTLLLVLFAILFLLSSVGCMHALYGFFLRRRGDPRRITAMGDYRSRTLEHTSTALIFPIYNEDVVRVFEGVRTTYESLSRTGQLPHFDLFVLS